MDINKKVKINGYGTAIDPSNNYEIATAMASIVFECRNASLKVPQKHYEEEMANMKPGDTVPSLIPFDEGIGQWRRELVDIQKRYKRILDDVYSAAAADAKKGLVEAVPEEAQSVLNAWRARENVSDEELEGLALAYPDNVTILKAVNETAERMHSKYTVGLGPKAERIERLNRAYSRCIIYLGMCEVTEYNNMYDCIVDDDRLPYKGPLITDYASKIDMARTAFADGLRAILNGTDRYFKGSIPYQGKAFSDVTIEEYEYIKKRVPEIEKNYGLHPASSVPYNNVLDETARKRKEWFKNMEPYVGTN